MNGDADGERLIEDVLAGEIAPEAPEVAARCARDPGFAAALAESLQMQRRLAAHAASVREDLATPAPELEDIAERAARSSAARHRAERRRPVWPWLAALAAAASLTFAIVTWSRSTSDDLEQVLGAFRVEALDDDTLRFGYELGSHEAFVVRVVDTDGKVVFTSLPLKEPTWSRRGAPVGPWQAGWRVRVAVERSDAEPVPGDEFAGWAKPR